MAFSLFDLHPGDKFHYPVHRNDDQLVRPYRGCQYVETSRYPISRECGFAMAKAVNLFGVMDNIAHIITFEGEYIDGDLADNYVVKNILTVWHDEDDWFISTFALDGE